MANSLWAVYVRTFDGYENVWKYQTGPFKSKKAANDMIDKIRKDNPTKEMIVRKF